MLFRRHWWLTLYMTSLRVQLTGCSGKVQVCRSSFAYSVRFYNLRKLLSLYSIFIYFGQGSYP